MLSQQDQLSPELRHHQEQVSPRLSQKEQLSLKARWLCFATSRERIGGWAPGSNMPDLYDRRFGTGELIVRSQIMQFFQGGGQLGRAFELPKKPKAKTKTRYSRRSSSSDSSSYTSSSSTSVARRCFLADFNTYYHIFTHTSSNLSHISNRCSTICSKRLLNHFQQC